LIRSGDMLQLLLCTGKIMMVSKNEARELLMNYDNPNYYASETERDYENLTMEACAGESVARYITKVLRRSFMPNYSKESSRQRKSTI